MKYARQFGTLPAPHQRDALNAALYSMLRDSSERYWNYALGRMNFVTDDNTTLVSQNGADAGYLVVGVNFNAFLVLDLVQQKCALKHACLHWLNGHVSSRINNLKRIYGAKVVGTATDLVISPLLDTTCLWEAGYIMPELDLYGFPEGLSTEQYCQLLAGHPTSTQQAPGAAGPVGNAEMFKQMLEQLFNQDPADNQMQGNDVVTKSIDEKLAEKITQAPPDWIKDGQVDKKKLKEAMENGEVMPLPFDELGVDQAGSLVDNNVSNLIKGAQARSGEKGQGWLTADGEEFIESLKRNSVISWNTLIHQKYRQHTDMLREATKSRPSRRHASYFGRRHASQCKILIWIDTSGSMGKRELSLINAELDYLVRRNIIVDVGHIDACVCKEPEKYKKGTTLSNFFGRGGTDFRPAFDYMAKNLRHDPPDFCIYFTDGMGSAHAWEDLPGWTKQLDVIWLITDTGYSIDEFKSSVADYGEAVAFDTHKGVPENKYK